jgi:hypothetical protein
MSASVVVEYVNDMSKPNTKNWGGRRVSNPRPPEPQSGVLPLNYAHHTTRLSSLAQRPGKFQISRVGLKTVPYRDERLRAALHPGPARAGRIGSKRLAHGPAGAHSLAP